MVGRSVSTLEEADQLQIQMDFHHFEPMIHAELDLSWCPFLDDSFHIVLSSCIWGAVHRSRTTLGSQPSPFINFLFYILHLLYLHCFQWLGWYKFRQTTHMEKPVSYSDSCTGYFAFILLPSYFCLGCCRNSTFGRILPLDESSVTIGYQDGLPNNLNLIFLIQPSLLWDGMDPRYNIVEPLYHTTKISICFIRIFLLL